MTTAVRNIEGLFVAMCEKNIDYHWLFLTVLEKGEESYFKYCTSKATKVYQNKWNIVNIYTQNNQVITYQML